MTTTTTISRCTMKTDDLVQKVQALEWLRFKALGMFAKAILWNVIEIERERLNENKSFLHGRQYDARPDFGCCLLFHSKSFIKCILCWHWQHISLKQFQLYFRYWMLLQYGWKLKGGELHGFRNTIRILAAWAQKLAQKRYFHWNFFQFLTNLI